MQNNQLPTKCTMELKDNSTMIGVYIVTKTHIIDNNITKICLFMIGYKETHHRL